MRCALTLTLLLLSSPALGQEAPTPTPQPRSPSGSAAGAAAGFVGHWKTSFGELVLERQGKLLRGTYGSGGAATIEGTVEGRRYRFRYQETAVQGEGWFELSPGGQSFAGKWREDGEKEWKDWRGQRAKAPAAGPPYSGLFRTQAGTVRLTQTGASVRGVYLYAGSWGRIEGQVKSGALHFRWFEGASEGEGEFRVGPKRVQLTGKWRAKGQRIWKTWNGQRVLPKPGVRWLVILEAHWEEELSRREYSFGVMLRAFFRRYPRVNVRHRRFGDASSLVRHARQIAFLAEPVVLVIASHGLRGELVAGSERVGSKTLAPLFADLSNLRLVHFSSCEVLVGDVPTKLRAKLPKGRALPLSGYATAVDWSASAVLEFLYFDLILGRGIAPAAAAKHVRRELSFANDEGVEGSPLGGLKFRFFP